MSRTCRRRPHHDATVFEHIDRYKPSLFFTAPTLYAALLAVPDAEKKYDLNSVRLCVSAAEALPAELYQQWEARFGVEILDGKGAQLELDLIRAGHERAYTGTGPFQVMLGRASAVELTLDGEPVDLSPHTRGNVARLTLGGETAAGTSETADSENH